MSRLYDYIEVRITPSHWVLKINCWENLWVLLHNTFNNLSKSLIRSYFNSELKVRIEWEKVNNIVFYVHFSSDEPYPFRKIKDKWVLNDALKEYIIEFNEDAWIIADFTIIKDWKNILYTN